MMQDDQSNRDDSNLIDYALNQLGPEQREDVAKQIASDEAAEATADEYRRIAGSLSSAFADDVDSSADLRKTIEAKLDSPTPANDSIWSPTGRFAPWRGILALTLLLLLFPASFIVMGWVANYHDDPERARSSPSLKDIGLALHSYSNTYLEPSGTREIVIQELDEITDLQSRLDGELAESLIELELERGQRAVALQHLESKNTALEFELASKEAELSKLSRQGRAAIVLTDGRVRHFTSEEWGRVAPNGRVMQPKFTDSKQTWVQLGKLEPDGALVANREGQYRVMLTEKDNLQLMVTPRILITEEEELLLGDELVPFGGESYEEIVENDFVPVSGQQAVSTFSIDVDTASYSNMRRFLTSGQLPPANAVRIEELVNYFHYDYPQPQKGEPFSVNMEIAECPWKSKHKLVRIGLKGREIAPEKRPASNLVFLIDVSGSMSDENKLPLLQRSMKLLVEQLNESDRVTIVTYAGDAGLRLEPTPGNEHGKIDAVIDGLTSGGSTHGSAGIQMAYQKAIDSFIDEGVNRVILATDGDLNVGITEDEALIDLIKEKAENSVFLTVLGFGTGNYQDAKLEKMADNGNGIFAYIDQLKEGKKVLVEQIGGSLVTIAKDVKIQVEFNPAEVASYRLIGYENRVMAAEDFDDDKKDAGEIGAGHTVTALYEIVLRDGDAAKPKVDTSIADVEKSRDEARTKYEVDLKKFGPEHPAIVLAKQHVEQLEQLVKEIKSLKYQHAGTKKTANELLTLNLRFKKPDSDTSKKIDFTLKDGKTRFNRATKDFQFAAAVASFGMMLRGSTHAGNSNYEAIEEIATGALGKDLHGYRAEFVELVQNAAKIK